MRPGLLRTLAKFAEGPSTGIRLNDYIGSTAYSLGAGEKADVPVKSVLKHSILPYLVSTGVGSGIGALAGMAAPGVLEKMNVIEPADPVGDATSVIADAGGEVSGLPEPSADKPDALLGQWWSDQIRDKAVTGGTFLGATVGQNLGRQEQFMHGVRDALTARASGRRPWLQTSVAPSGVRVPWKAQS